MDTSVKLFYLQPDYPGGIPPSKDLTSSPTSPTTSTDNKILEVSQVLTASAAQIKKPDKLPIQGYSKDCSIPLLEDNFKLDLTKRDETLKTEKEAIMKIEIEAEDIATLKTVKIEATVETSDTILFYKIFSKYTTQAIKEKLKNDPSFCAYLGSKSGGNFYWRALTAISATTGFGGNRIGVGWTDKVLFACISPAYAQLEFWKCIKEKDSEQATKKEWEKFVFDLSMHDKDAKPYYPKETKPGDWQMLQLDDSKVSIQLKGFPKNLMWVTDDEEDPKLEEITPYVFQDIKERCFRYSVSIDNSIPESILRYAYPYWQDGDILTLEQLGNLVSLVEEAATIGPVWIHCRSGVGRTGTLIAAVILKEQIENKTIKQATYREDLVRLVVGLRLHRNLYFVHTECQLALLENYGQSLFNLASKTT